MRSAPRPVTALLAATALLALVVAAACGSGDSPQSLGDGDSVASGGFAGGDDAAVPASGGATFASSESAPNPPREGSGSLDLLGRTIIRNGSLTLEVESVAESFDAVVAVAAGNGGFVADSTFFRTGGGENGDGEATHFARLTIRVPAERFHQTLDDLRALAVEVRSVSTSSQDVTGEVTDLESELRNLRAVEGQYLELLGRANEVGAILQVQDRLFQTRAQIERAEGRIALLRSLADLATLQVELHAPAAPPAVEGGSGPLAAAAGAWDASLATLGAIATVGLVVIVFSWWLLPLIVLVLLGLRRWPPRRLAARYD